MVKDQLRFLTNQKSLQSLKARQGLFPFFTGKVEFSNGIH